MVNVVSVGLLNPIATSVIEDDLKDVEDEKQAC